MNTCKKVAISLLRNEEKKRNETGKTAVTVECIYILKCLPAVIHSLKEKKNGLFVKNIRYFVGNLLQCVFQNQHQINIINE